MRYMLYLTNLDHTIPSNVKYFWSFINFLKEDSGLSNTMKFNSKDLTTSGSMAPGFAEYFESCYRRHSNIVADNTSDILHHFGNLSSYHFSTAEIANRLQILTVERASVLMAFLQCFLRMCFDSPAEPLRNIFQKSLDSAVSIVSEKNPLTLTRERIRNVVAVALLCMSFN